MKDDQGNKLKTFSPVNYSPENSKDSNKVNIDNPKIQKQPYEQIIIRISNNIPQPPKDPKVRSLDTAIKATTGQAVVSGSSEKMMQETARELWRRGTNPDKLESAVRGSSATLNERDMKNLLGIAGEIRKLNKAYPNTTKEFGSLPNPKDTLEIKNLSPGELKRNENAVILEKNELGLRAQRDENEYYSPEYVNESQDYLEGMSDYAEDVSEQPEDVEYEEPETSPPPIRTQTPSTQKSEPSETGFRDVLDRGRSAVSDAGKKLMNNASSAAKQATKKAISGAGKALGTALANIAPYVAIAGLILTGFALWLIQVIIVTVIAIFGFIFIALFITFIINSGAYMVPPGESISTPPSTGDYQCLDVENKGCPCGWPVLPYEGEGVLDVYQGSHSPRGCGTHSVIEAIDIIHLPEESLSEGHPVTSRVTGTVLRTWPESFDPNDYWGWTYGNGIEIQSDCFGVSILLRYGHNSIVNVTAGQSVNMGDTIAYSGNSGMGGPHVHYEFAGGGLVMTVPNIPKDVPQTCDSYGGCVCSFCCNVQVP
jgi:Peptidase family M23